MKSFSTLRNFYIIIGLCFLLAFIMNLSMNKPVLLLVLGGLTSIMCFINAYNYHRKIPKVHKD